MTITDRTVFDELLDALDKRITAAEKVDAETDSERWPLASAFVAGRISEARTIRALVRHHQPPADDPAEEARP